VVELLGVEVVELISLEADTNTRDQLFALGALEVELH
jgi:hypothetical protein